jgi:DNA-binding CsgD family transcriptional regulator
MSRARAQGSPVDEREIPTDSGAHASPVQRPSGFQRAGSAETATQPPDAAPPARLHGKWTIIEQFVLHGYEYRLIRSPQIERDASRLTKRERQVVEQALDGHTNKSIAYALGVSQSTVGVLIFRASAKLGVKSRAELLSAYTRLTLTDEA